MLIIVCETEIKSLGLNLNYSKSVCMGVGPGHLVHCVNIKTINGNVLDWLFQ